MRLSTSKLRLSTSKFHVIWADFAFPVSDRRSAHDSSIWAVNDRAERAAQTRSGTEQRAQRADTRTHGTKRMAHTRSGKDTLVKLLNKLRENETWLPNTEGRDGTFLVLVFFSFAKSSVNVGSHYTCGNYSATYIVFLLLNTETFFWVFFLICGTRFILLSLICTCYISYWKKTVIDNNFDNRLVGLSHFLRQK